MPSKELLFRMEAEQSDRVLVKVLTALIRRRMRLLSFRSWVKEGAGLLYIHFSVEENEENAEKLRKQLATQIGVLGVSFMEQQTKATCKTEPQKNSSTLSRG